MKSNLHANSKKSLVCVCYRPPSCDLDEWLKLFTAFLETTSLRYEKVLITGDFNFPDLILNSTLLSDSAEKTVSFGSVEFREIILDFYLQQINIFPTRSNNILDLVLTTCPEDICNLSCIQPKTMDLFSDHNLLFFLLFNTREVIWK